jgi:signal transduction histidine kinase
MTFRFAFESSSGNLLIGGVAIDVTTERRTEEGLRLREDQLRRAQKMDAVGILAGGIAHEFNNILQVIQGHATFAIQGLAENDPRFQDLEQLLKAAEHASVLTKQMLRFGRRQLLQLAEVDLNQLVQDLAKMIRPLAAPNVKVEVAVDDDIEIVLADSDQLRQALINLCINARDAMPQGGKLFLETELHLSDGGVQPTHLKLRSGHYVVIRVADTGPGMTDTIKEHIFEPFFTTKKDAGTGLGLWVSKGIVEKHQGRLEVMSSQRDEDHGTAFVMTLPQRGVMLKSA